MKNFGLLVVVTFAIVGCRSSYDVTLTNGTRYTGVSKPRLNKKTGMYKFKTPDGREGSFYQANVRLIQPHEDSYTPSFKPSEKK